MDAGVPLKRPTAGIAMGLHSWRTSASPCLLRHPRRFLQRCGRVTGLQVVAGDLLAARAAGVHEVGFVAAGVHPRRDARRRRPPVAPLGDAEEDRPQLAAGLASGGSRSARAAPGTAASRARPRSRAGAAGSRGCRAARPCCAGSRRTGARRARARGSTSSDHFSPRNERAEAIEQGRGRRSRSRAGRSMPERVDFSNPLG